MAIIHVSEAEAARDLSALLNQLSSGTEIRIDRGEQTIAVLQSPSVAPIRKTLSEAIRHADQRASNVLLDDQFGDDVEAGIRSHEHEYLINPWE